MRRGVPYREWTEEEKKQKRAQNRAWYRRHREEVLRYKREYRKQIRERRKKVLETFGAKCFACGKSDGNLNLHHRKGFKSPYLEPLNKDTQYRRTLKEAERHPERFVLLCPPCHTTLSVLASSPERRRRLLSLL